MTLTKASKFLSLVLRHKPEKAGLTLDDHGWANVSDIISKMGLTKKELDQVVSENDKGRFEYSPDGLQIRACQGHSVSVDLELPTLEPPKILYHGTPIQNLTSIGREGLKPGQRQDVHMSADYATAKKVGGRRGDSVVLYVKAAQMAAEGAGAFRVSANGVWLTKHVPFRYLGMARSEASLEEQIRIAYGENNV